MQETKQLLQHFYAFEPPVPQDMERRLEQLIDTMAEEESKSRQRKVRLVVLRWVAGIAASVVLVWGVSNNLYQPRQHTEVNTPEEAVRVTTDALMLFSETLNEGMNTLQY